MVYQYIDIMLIDSLSWCAPPSSPVPPCLSPYLVPMSHPVSAPPSPLLPPCLSPSSSHHSIGSVQPLLASSISSYSALLPLPIASPPFLGRQHWQNAASQETACPITACPPSQETTLAAWPLTLHYSVSLFFSFSGSFRVSSLSIVSFWTNQGFGRFCHTLNAWRRCKQGALLLCWSHKKWQVACRAYHTVISSHTKAARPLFTIVQLEK